MSVLEKAKALLMGNRDKAKEAVNKVGDLVDDKTGGKYADKVDKAQEKANDLLDKGGEGKAEDKPE